MADYLEVQPGVFHHKDNIKGFTKDTVVFGAGSAIPIEGTAVSFRAYIALQRRAAREAGRVRLRG